MHHRLTMSRLAVHGASGVLVTLAVVMTGGTVQAAHQFGDVPNGGFHDFIDWMAENGVTSGCTVAQPPFLPNYCPDSPVTRGQMAVFIKKGAVVPSPPRTVNCATESLQAAIDDARPGDVFDVQGTCNESVRIPARLQDITLNGQGSATINGTDSALEGAAAVLILGSGVRITGFTVTGSGDGIDVALGGFATIDNNTITGNARIGISLLRHGTAQISGNTITNNGSHGISLQEHSSARIGFSSPTATTGNPNTIQNNVSDGIFVAQGSSARICCNTISNNGRNGIVVILGSRADIANNTIDQNGGDGISMYDMSSVTLGSQSGAGILGTANRTTVNNSGVGIECSGMGVASGHLGTLNGMDGPKLFPATQFCLDTLDSLPN